MRTAPRHRYAASAAVLLGLAASGPGAPSSHAQFLQTFELEKLVARDGATLDRFGDSVSLWADRALVGAPSDDTAAGADAGSACVFQRQADGSWTQTSKLTAGDAAASDALGEAVALHRDRALVGAPGHDASAGVDAGAAYLWERQANGGWLQVAKLTASDAAGSSSFGNAVSLAGARAMVGAYGADSAAGANAGAAYLYERQGDGSWLEVARLAAADAAPVDLFGRSVSLSGDRALVGAPDDDTAAGANAGSAYVFERQPSGGWSQTAKLTASLAASFDRFGYSVSLDGERALVGAYAASSSDAGAAYVFERQGDGSWLQMAKLSSTGFVSGDWFGISVSLEGQRALVGAERHGVAAPDSGTAYLFERQASGIWPLVAQLAASDGAQLDLFGHAVSLSGERVLAGAVAKSTSLGAKSGAAYVFRSCDGCLAPYGSGTPGCWGTQTMFAGSAPELGMADFRFTCDRAPPSSLGHGAIALVPDLGGTDVFGLGFLVHLDLPTAPALFRFEMSSDAQGEAQSPPIAIAGDPSAVGLTLYAQSFWSWTSCPIPFVTVSSSSSRGLAFTILAP